MTSIYSDNVSLAQRTGTRIDSAAKHIVACRVDEDYFLENHEPIEKLRKQEYLYAMQKDEIVMNCSVRTNGVVRRVAYPYVVTTLGQNITEEQKRRLVDYYHDLSFQTIVDQVPFPFPRELRFQGISVGTGHPTTLKGDTFASAMVGGMVTIMNGHFPSFTGDLVQWYFDFEEVMFGHEGYRMREQNHLMPGTVERVPAAQRRRLLDLPDVVKRREAELETVQRRNMYGTYKAYNAGKHNVFFPKSVMPVKDAATGEILEVAKGDTERVFGKVINGGGPWEWIDIMITNVFLP